MTGPICRAARVPAYTCAHCLAAAAADKRRVIARLRRQFPVDRVVDRLLRAAPLVIEEMRTERAEIIARVSAPGHSRHVARVVRMMGREMVL